MPVNIAQSHAGIGRFHSRIIIQKTKNNFSDPIIITFKCMPTLHFSTMYSFLSLFLKLVPTIFYQIFIFSSNDRPSKTEKCFLFHLKSSFRSRDIQIYVIFSLHFHTFQTQKGKWKCNNL